MGKGAKMQERTQFIIQELAAGRTQADLGRELGLSRERVGQIIHEAYEQRVIEKYVPQLNEYGVSILRLKRHHKGITLKEVCALTGISYCVLSHIENGLSINEDKAKILSEFYGTPINELFVLPIPNDFGIAN